jgi:hypothetical protein
VSRLLVLRRALGFRAAFRPSSLDSKTVAFWSPAACPPVAGAEPEPPWYYTTGAVGAESQWNSPGDVRGLGVGAILSNGGKRRSLRVLVWHGLIERDLVARDG